MSWMMRTQCDEVIVWLLWDSLNFYLFMYFFFGGLKTTWIHLGADRVTNAVKHVRVGKN